MIVSSLTQVDGCGRGEWALWSSMSCVWAAEAVVVEEVATGVWVDLVERERNDRRKSFDLTELLAERSNAFKSIASRALSKEGSLSMLRAAIGIGKWDAYKERMVATASGLW